MENSKSQLDIASTSVRPILQALGELMPSLEKLVTIYHAMVSNPVANKNLSLCDLCSKRENCSEPCKKLNSLLPKINSGKNNHEKKTGFNINTLQEIEKTRLADSFEQFQACKHIFTNKQWSVIYLYYYDGMTQSQIANQLGKSRKSVSGLFIRAKQKKEGYFAQLRSEKIDYLKKKTNSYDE